MPSTIAVRPQTGTGGELVDRFFEVSLYLLVATGFLTLAAAGKLDAGSLLFILAVLLARGILLARNRTLTIPTRWTNFATLVYVAFYAADFFLISQNFVYATVHLVLFSMAVKIFSVQRERDRVYLAVLSFLMVLAASVLTVDAGFFFSFCLFLLLATATFISMEMRRSAATAQARAPSTAPRGLIQALSLFSVLLVALTMLAGLVIFFVLPRTSGGYLSSLAQKNEFVTGFSNDVQLGNIGEIKQSRAVVMHVQVGGDSRGAYSDLKWRGVTLSLFDGRRWSNPLYRGALQPAADGYFHVPQASAEGPLQRPYRALNYRVLMEPIGTDYFFLAPVALGLSGQYRHVLVDGAGAVSSSDEPVGAYNGVSNIAEDPPQLANAPPGAIAPAVALRYLQLPKLGLRTRALAQQVASTAGSNYAKAIALEDYLKTHYEYTLQLPKAAPADPLEDFLFERKRGSCEHFASAMAIMLRATGIPSRLVNGFRGGQFNDVTSSYIVRASDAHSWVEAYFPGYGWATFDPTPPDPRPAAGQWSRAALYFDALGEFWREWVVNYDFTHQLQLNNQVLAGSRQAVNTWKAGLLRRYQTLLRRAEEIRTSGIPSRTRWTVVSVCALLLLGANSRRWFSYWRRWRLAASPEVAPRAAATVWYERMTHTVARRGFSKKSTQTPEEFVASILQPQLRQSVARFTKRYERARFGGDSDDAKLLPALYEEIKGGDQRN